MSGLGKGANKWLMLKVSPNGLVQSDGGFRGTHSKENVNPSLDAETPVRGGLKVWLLWQPPGTEEKDRPPSN